MRGDPEPPGPLPHGTWLSWEGEGSQRERDWVEALGDTGQESFPSDGQAASTQPDSIGTARMGKGLDSGGSG